MGIGYKLSTEFGLGGGDQVPGVPLSITTVLPMITGEDGVLLALTSSTVPSTAGVYAPGCILIKTAATAGVYINKGTKASPNFTLVTQA